MEFERTLPLVCASFSMLLSLCVGAASPNQGDNRYPDRDPHGRLFSLEYEPRRYAMSGKPILGHDYACVLEGVQADQEFARHVFRLQQHYGRKMCCHYCNVIAWTSRCPKSSEPNNPASLYTNFSRDPEMSKLVYIFTAIFWPAGSWTYRLSCRSMGRRL